MLLPTWVDDPGDYPKLSQSELYSLNRCKKMWDYNYMQGLVPKTTPDYFAKGSFVHRVLAEYLEALQKGKEVNLDTLSRTVQGEVHAEMGTTVGEPDRLSIVAQLKEYWNDVGTPPPESIIAVEEEFYADLDWQLNDEPVLFHGFIDAVVRDDEGNLWIIEHKTASRAWSASQFQFAYQGKLYADAWERLTGERPVGIQYNFFYPKRYEIRQQYVSEEESRLIREEIGRSVQLRESIIGMQLFPREPKWGCNDCQYKDLCLAELSGVDSDYIRKTQFKVDEDRKARFAT